MKRKLFLLLCALLTMIGVQAETDYTDRMSDDWTGSTGNFQGGKEHYQGSTLTSSEKVLYQSFTAPATGIYEIKFYAVTSSTAERDGGVEKIYGPNIAQAYATAGENKATVGMNVIAQTGCTLVQDANIRTLSVEATEGETIEYGLENIAKGGNWYTIKALSAKMKTVAEIFQAQYDEAYAIWANSTENEVGARATFKTYVDALNTAMSGTLAQAQTASDNLAAALVVYESKSYPVKGSGVKYDFTSKMSMAINAWTCVQGNGPAQYGFTGATETYKGSAYAIGDVMYQTITGLALGEYEIHFYAVANSPRGESASGQNIAYVYANDQTQDIDVIAQDGCDPSQYERVFTVMVKDGTIKYGLSNKAAGGNWYVCKNVAFYMTGAPDLSDYYDAIEAKLITATEIKDSGSKMSTSVATDLQDAIDATEGYTSITIIGVLEKMSDDLTVAIDNANASINAYANLATALTTANAAIAAPYKTKGKTEFQAAIDQAQSVYNNNDAATGALVTEVADLNTALETFNTANYVTFEGVYYVKNAAGKYMAAGHNYGTRGIVNEIGLDLTLTPDNTNKVSFDSRVANNNTSHFLGSNLYMDSGTFAWAIEQVGEDEYSISNGTQYIGVDAEDNLVLVNEPAAWKFILASDVTAARMAALSTATADNGVDATFLMGNPNFNRNDQRSTWQKEQGQTGEGHSVTIGGGCDASQGNACSEAYHTDFTISQVVANAPVGIYKLSAQGFYRQDKNGEEVIVEETPVFFIGNQNCDVPVLTGEENSMKTAAISFTNGLYEIDPVEFAYNGKDGLQVGVKGTGEHQWVIFDNFRLTYYGGVADAEDYAALNAAIETAENKTLGFETGEYAPYTNKEALTVLNVAKAIDQSASNLKTDVQGATTALTNASWTANEEEVNAFRWNKAEDYSSEGETKVPTGGFIGSDANSRISHNPASNAGLTGLDQRMALMVISNTNATYGETEGYTLPLKAYTVYEFKFKYAGWGECGTPTITILKGNETIKSAPLSTPAKTGNDNTDAWETASVVFTTTEAGDYKVRFSTADGRDAFGDLELKKAPASVSVTLDAETGYATFGSQYPLNLTPENLATGVKAYKATTVDGENIAFEALEQGVPANTGLLIAGEPGQVVNIPVATSTSAVEGNLLQVNAAGNTFDAETGCSYYGLKKGTKEFRPFNPESVAIPANKAYLRVENINPARLTIRFDGEDPTAINALEAADTEDGSLKDGKYLIGTKVVLVKNGVKYGANGQILK